MKKKVYIVSHSHWDREWYMSYEDHHMRLVTLMDDLLELFKKDPNFNSFHLDGQTILIDDYLEVRPDKKAEVKQAIESGKLHIGPFYILQDAFLVSSESNTRNMLIGMAESKKWGTPVMLGYFPDTFGNMGQTPQMMKQANLQSAAFGRGVKPIGFDNQVLVNDYYTSQYSEMFWEGPDGSEIFGLLFANWYSNGNEIPTNVEEAKEFWKQKLAEVEKFGSTNHYLLMNGVDHQPVQKDITTAIQVANQLFPDYEFIHSNFTDYLEAVQKDLPEDLGKVHGELTSQETDGWYTLANTASTRVYLKQWNTRVSRQLENIAEPLATMAYELTGDYPHDQLDYAWKTLMQNHPHDSICGCSVDEVHREMVTRFEKAYQVGNFVSSEAVSTVADSIDTSDFPSDSKPFVVFNTTGINKSGTITLEVEVERKTFKEGIPSHLFDQLNDQESKNYCVIDKNGEKVKAIISEEKVRFNYELPKEQFRIPYMEKYVTVTVEVKEMEPFSWESFGLIIGENHPEGNKLVQKEGRVLENSFVKVEIEENGSISLTSKETNKKIEQLLVFEDVGDIGNEYIFKRPEGDKGIFSTDFPHQVEILENSMVRGRVLLTHTLNIPKSADEQLEKEQQAVVDFQLRKAQRSEETLPLTIQTIISIDHQNKNVDFETSLNNQMKDHRLRVLFPTTIHGVSHEADSIYEVVTRPNKVSSHWKNPTNPQHQHAFVNLHDEEFGVTVSNYGLNEYEIMDDTIALTLLRCVGELGDWGYFPTPEAQCLDEYTFHFAIQLHGKPESRYATYKQAQAWQVPFIGKQTTVHEGKMPSKMQYLNVDGETFSVTALKRRREDDQLILRGYNLANKDSKLTINKKNQKKLALLNLLEEEVGEINETLGAYEIRTIGIEEE